MCSSRSLSSAAILKKIILDRLGANRTYLVWTRAATRLGYLQKFLRSFENFSSVVVKQSSLSILLLLLCLE